MKAVYFSLGSNLGNREKHLENALELLELQGIHVLRRSSIFETEPQDVQNQPWFLNVVAEARTRLFPIQLLRRVLRIERELGRQRITPKGPRTIDIDILFYGRITMQTPELTIPHPALTNRRFVLAPLAELEPDLRHPVTGKTMKELLDALPNQEVRRLLPP